MKGGAPRANGATMSASAPSTSIGAGCQRWYAAAGTEERSMSKTPGRNAALAVGVLGILAAVGCGDETVEYPFEDQAGRHCVRTCTGDDCTFDCDATAAPAGGCPASTTPCFTMAYNGVAPPAPPVLLLALCDSCCSGTGSTWVLEDCSAIVCTVDRDCAVGDAYCEGGYCRREGY